MAVVFPMFENLLETEILITCFCDSETKSFTSLFTLIAAHLNGEKAIV